MADTAFTFSSPLRYLHGVGPQRAAQLAAMGLSTMGDLLQYYPYRYLDASAIVRVVDLQLHSICTIQVVVQACRPAPSFRRQLPLTVMASDDSGQIALTFFHQPYLAKQLRVGESYAFTGRVSEHRGHLTMVNPVWEPWGDELVHTGRIVPMYSQSGGVKTGALRKLAHQVLTILADRLDDGEYLDPAQRAAAAVVPLATARRDIHFPPDLPALAAAKRRLAVDELWPIVARIAQDNQQRQQQMVPTVIAPTVWESTQHLLQTNLPFALSDSQQAAMKLLAQELTRTYPSQFLVQGEVGSGKTLVAAGGGRQGFGPPPVVKLSSLLPPLFLRSNTGKPLASWHPLCLPR